MSKQEVVTAYEQTFNSAVGEKVLKDLEDKFYNTMSFNTNDPYGTAFKEGQRYIVQYIKNMLQGKIKKGGRAKT